jgi:death-on-curing protein
MKLEEADIIRLHEGLLKYDNISPGYRNKGDIGSLVDKLDEKLFGQIMYNEPFKKGAVLFEGLIRLHPFIDGNKRTALVSLQQYLINQNIIFVIPLSAVRFCIRVAQNRDISQDGIDKVIESIEKWVRSRSKDVNDLAGISGIIKSDIHFLEKVNKISQTSGDKKLTEKVINFFLAFDMYPFNEIGFKDVLVCMQHRYRDILDYLKK